MIGGSNNLRFNLFPDPVGHFGLSGRLGVAGGAALQAVSECPQRRMVGFIWVATLKDDRIYVLTKESAPTELIKIAFEKGALYSQE